jgi:hypothetical protein
VVEQLRVGTERLHKPRAEPVQRHVAPERRLKAALQPRQELRLGDLAALEREQRVHAVAGEAVLERRAVHLGRKVDLVLHAVERGHQGHGQHAAEIRHHRLDHARRRRS